MRARYPRWCGVLPVRSTSLPQERNHPHARIAPPAAGGPLRGDGTALAGVRQDPLRGGGAAQLGGARRAGVNGGPLQQGRVGGAGNLPRLRRPQPPPARRARWGGGQAAATWRRARCAAPPLYHT
eukprot:838070-Prorocentrum_minimum.AAC.1